MANDKASAEMQKRVGRNRAKENTRNDGHNNSARSYTTRARSCLMFDLYKISWESYLTDKTIVKLSSFPSCDQSQFPLAVTQRCTARSSAKTERGKVMNGSSQFRFIHHVSVSNARFGKYIYIYI